MANNAESSQNKSDNLGRGRVAYAFKVSRVNPDFVSFKIWILGYYSKVCSIAVASLPLIIAQIDTALAEGDCEFEIGGIRFSADEKLLGKIRKELSSYCCSGVSDANNAPVKPSCIAATESVKKCGAKQKASAPQGSASAARQISGIKNEELRMKNGESIDLEKSSSFFVHRSSFSPDASAVADGLIQAFRAALQAELAPIRATLEELSTILNEERRTKNEELSTPADVVQRRDGTKGKNSSFLILNSSLYYFRFGRFARQWSCP